MPNAHGRPGISPRWTSSAKTGLGTALSTVSRVWFTISHGILNEIYYPRVDQACTRDCGLIITDGADFFSEEKRDCASTVETLEDGVPAYRLTNTHRYGRYRIIKRVVADSRHDVVLQQITLEADPAEPPLCVFALLAPHLVNSGAHNSAWVDTYKGQRMLFAGGSGTFLALGADHAFPTCSVGFVGINDGWQQLQAERQLVDQYDRAEDGNVALTAELAMWENAPVILAIGFGRSPAEAAFRVRASLNRSFDGAIEEYAADWRAWQAHLRSLDRRAEGKPSGRNTYRISTAVLRM